MLKLNKKAKVDYLAYGFHSDTHMITSMGDFAINFIRLITGLDIFEEEIKETAKDENAYMGYDKVYTVIRDFLIKNDDKKVEFCFARLIEICGVLNNGTIILFNDIIKDFTQKDFDKSYYDVVESIYNFLFYHDVEDAHDTLNNADYNVQLELFYVVIRTIIMHMYYAYESSSSRDKMIEDSESEIIASFVPTIPQ